MHWPHSACEPRLEERGGGRGRRRGAFLTAASFLYLLAASATAAAAAPTRPAETPWPAQAHVVRPPASNAVAGGGSSTSSNNTNNSSTVSVVSSSGDGDPGGGDGGGLSKKSAAVLFILLAGLVVGLVINFANLHTDFQDVRDFHRGYLGRRMLIAEGRLTSREYLDALRVVQERIEEGRPVIPPFSAANHLSTLVSTMGNGHAGNPGAAAGGFCLESSLSAIQEERRELNPHCHSNFAAFTSVRPFAGAEPAGRPDHPEWLQKHIPLYAAGFIEDHDPEWRDLDYSIDIGDPPDDLCEFILQYDFGLFWHGDDEDEQECGKAAQLNGQGKITQTSFRELVGRRNLLYQFRKWKKRRRKLWRIVVTERAKKEMASQDNIGGGRR